MQNFDDVARRSFLGKLAAFAGGAIVLAGAPAALAQERSPSSRQKAEEVTPVEDLCREHGLLNRVLLIYDEATRRLSAQSDLDPKHVAEAAGIIRRFIEQYHEKLEEDHLFPRFVKARKLVDLVAVLRRQHEAGRGLTAQILQHATPAALKNAADRVALEQAIAAFVRMYRPHEAREDTVLFPALRSIVSGNEYDSLGEDFEDKEHQLFGAEGFEGELEKVVAIERAMGLYDLSKFTP